MADPTVTDVFNQLVLVNGKLDQVEVNTSLMANINASINAGAAATVGRLDVLALIEVEAVKLLFHTTQQNDAIICVLEKISRNTCGILTQVTEQTELQRQMAADIADLRALAESTHADAALDLRHRHELQATIEKCCPPPRHDPACTYTPCEHPDPIKEPPKLPPIDRGRDDKPDDKPDDRPGGQHG